ncbi:MULTISPECIES: response regulator [Olivibacter]|uniref:Two component transcriptional regulator, LuxR family n=3 Tax=Sphingobacteriaceae TaxID=84566 RepID=F4C5S4_SPHS2|nr:MULTISPECIES: response regulator transcription factor [Olivibacter]MCL4640938.1 response regulator transcription factor [Olivibacter sp. UJ_SKK_5.1]MDM8175351.1 response regulator transcription factor [Olivibacter sp. 47]MDX3913856.1 response regulator transcription factor [Pseudosphingobacterium sp.]QEL02114.1 response regulator transcription factor [Olivibacter sp. LS-1]
MSYLNSNIRLAIVDDHQIVIEGLKTLLTNHSEIEVVDCFISGAEFMAFLTGHEVDVVLLDVMLPDGSGIDWCKEIKIKAPNVSVLALSNHAERSFVMKMLQNGASGYLLKNVSVDDLVHAIKAAYKGEIAFSREVNEIIAKPTLNELKGPPQLTKREKQILSMIAEGKTTANMAETLFLSPLTVETHRRNLLQKFEVKNVAELIKEALQQRLL